MKEEAVVAKKEEERKKEEMTKKEVEAKRSKETTKDMVVRWWLGLLQGSSSEDVDDAPVCLSIYAWLYIFIWMNNVASWWMM
jgi:hypothetical protein